MLALATTEATVSGRAADTPEAPRQRDSHGAPLPQVPVERGPFGAHRAPFSSRVRGATRSNGGTDAEVHLQTWYLDPDAWPVHKGDVITDTRDSSRWRIESADLVPAGLGLDQVMAACMQLDTAAS